MGSISIRISCFFSAFWLIETLTQPITNYLCLEGKNVTVIQSDWKSRKRNLAINMCQWCGRHVYIPADPPRVLYASGEFQFLENAGEQCRCECLRTLENLVSGTCSSCHHDVWLYQWVRRRRRRSKRPSSSWLHSKSSEHGQSVPLQIRTIIRIKLGLPISSSEKSTHIWSDSFPQSRLRQESDCDTNGDERCKVMIPWTHRNQRSSHYGLIHTRAQTHCPTNGVKRQCLAEWLNNSHADCAIDPWRHSTIVE